MLGLNLYDYSARYYEPAIGRFTTVDPHAENYYSGSPYAYVGNNPLKYIDPTGMDSIYFQSTFIPPAPARPLTGFYQQDNPYKYIGTYAAGESSEIVPMVDLAVTEVSPDYAYEIGGVIRNYEGAIIGEKPLVSVHPEFEALTLIRGLTNLASKKVIEKASGKGIYAPKDKHGNSILTQKTKAGNTKIDAEARGNAHTQLRTDETGNYVQRTTFDANGRKRSDTHFTTHGEVGKSNPHKHTYYKDERRQKPR